MLLLAPARYARIVAAVLWVPRTYQGSVVGSTAYGSGTFCNLSRARFIPQVVKLRTSMLLASMFAAVALYGQTGASTQPAAPAANGGGTRPGAAPTRATGLAPTSPALSGTSSSTGALANANGTNNGTANGAASGSTNGGNGARSRRGARRGNTRGANQGGGAANNASSHPPAPDADSRIVVTGYPAQNASGTANNPLLPIVSMGNALGIRSGTPIQVRLDTTIDSGHVRNGDMVNGTLAAPIANLPIGTPVRLTVVQSARAGMIASYGELSIQVVSIADRPILSDTITAIGETGKKELPDAAPGRGTEAVFTPDQAITLPAA